MHLPTTSTVFWTTPATLSPFILTSASRPNGLGSGGGRHKADLPSIGAPRAGGSKTRSITRAKSCLRCLKSAAGSRASPILTLMHSPSKCHSERPMQVILDRLEAISKILLIIGNLAGGFWAIREYFDKKHDARVAETFRVCAQIFERPLLAAQTRIGMAWLCRQRCPPHSGRDHPLVQQRSSPRNDTRDDGR